MASEQRMLSLYNYFAWADHMRRLYEASLNSPESLPGRGDPTTWVTMSYWYSGLYVIVEAWQENLKGLEDKRIDSLLQKQDLVKLLKKYRNATFHYQPKLFHSKHIDLMKKGEEARNWIENVHKAFGDFLEKWFEESGHLANSRKTERELTAGKTSEGRNVETQT